MTPVLPNGGAMIDLNVVGRPGPFTFGLYIVDGVRFALPRDYDAKWEVRVYLRQVDGIARIYVVNVPQHPGWVNTPEWAVIGACLFHTWFQYEVVNYEDDGYA